jgi:hypothetical protein
MLRPMDIVALARATSFSLLPNGQDLYTYTRWWRQIFHNKKWTDLNRHIKVIGKDLIRLISAIHRWDYFDTSAIKLLIIILEESFASINEDRESLASINEDGESLATINEDGEPFASVNEDHAATRSLVDTARKALLLESIDMSYMWSSNENAVPERDVQVCVSFMSSPSLTYIDLYFLWAQALLEPIEAAQPFNMDEPFLYPNLDGTLAPLRQIELPDGAMRSEDSIYCPGDIWFKAWHTDSLSNSSISQAITRPDIQTDPRWPTGFPREGIVRLLVQQEGHLLLPLWSSAARELWLQLLAIKPRFAEW